MSLAPVKCEARGNGSRPRLVGTGDQRCHRSGTKWDRYENLWEAMTYQYGGIVDGKKSAKQGLDDAATKVDDLLTTG